MKTSVHVRAAGLTDRGLHRPRNEDAFLCDEAAGLFAVADGLGGLPKGELAATTAIDVLRNDSQIAGDAEPDWQAVFDRANAAVVAAGRRIGVNGIGTTFTVARVVKNRLSVGHVGDSGLFVFASPGHTSQVTEDHTEAQELMESQGLRRSEIPEQCFHTLTRCLGLPRTPPVQSLSLKIWPGTRFLLYTDGVTKTMTPDELDTLVFKTDTPDALVRQIVDTANARGGPDNVTAVAIFC